MSGATMLVMLLVTLVRLTVGGLFLLGAWAKLIAGRGFRDQWLAAYHVPQQMVTPVGWALPLTEVALGVALILGLLGRPTPVASAGLLGAMTTAVVINLLHHRRPPCGCWGQLYQRLIDWHLVGRNLVLIGALIGVAGYGTLSPGLGSALTRPWQAAVLVLVTGVIVVTAVARSHSSRQEAGAGVGVTTTHVDSQSGIDEFTVSERSGT
jgi:uncharacterized membrane protein YphA (DoxX/SURF4 family)